MDAQEHTPSRHARLLAFVASPRGLLLTCVALLCWLPVMSSIYDPDFWWHLRAGQILLSTHHLIATDPFTYTVPTHAWTMHEWLTEVVFALLHSAFGLWSIIVLFAILTWIGLMCLLARAQLRQPNYRLLAIGIVLAVITGYTVWGPRAQMMTFAFLCVTLLMTERHLLFGGKAIWWLVPLTLLWSNLHSGVLAGVGFMGIIVVAELIGRLVRAPDGAPIRNIRHLVAVVVACVAAGSINPNGPLFLLYPFGTQGSPAQQALIDEWQSPNFHAVEFHGFEVMLLTLVALIVWNRRIRARDIALCLVGTGFALQSARHIALFVAATTPVWIDQASIALARRRVQGTTTHRMRPAGPPFLFRAVVSVIAIATVCGIIAIRGVSVMSVTEDSLSYARTYPVCAAEWLAGARKPLRIFNQYGDGGYLSYRLAGMGDRVFIFGDAALMGDDMLNEYNNIVRATPQWDTDIEKAGTDVVLFTTNTPLTTLLTLSPRWQMVYSDPQSTAFIRRGSNVMNVLPPAPQDTPTRGTCGLLAQHGITGTSS